MATGVAIGIGSINIGSLYQQRTAVIVATMFQAVGTGLVMLHVMAHLRPGIIPKRDEHSKAKNPTQLGISSVTFAILWVVAFYIAQIWLIFFEEYRISIPNFFPDLDYGYYVSYIMIAYALFGFTMSIVQHWLIKQYTGTSIRYWHVFTTLGWLLVSLFPVFFDDYRYSIELTLIWFIVPSLFQAILMSRFIRYGWLWMITGIVAGGIQLTIRYPIYSINYYTPSHFISGLILSVITALSFISLNSGQRYIGDKEKVE